MTNQDDRVGLGVGQGKRMTIRKKTEAVMRLCFRERIWSWCPGASG